MPSYSYLDASYTTKAGLHYYLYHPLEDIDVSILSPHGAQIVRCDENLSKATQDALMKSEAGIMKKRTDLAEFLYLFREHKPLYTYKTQFVARNETGLSHVAGLIAEDLNQSYAQLVGAYASDRDLPFIISMLLLNDLRAVEGGFHYFIRTRNSLVSKPWTPTPVKTRPPINTFKMSQSGHASFDGIDDSFILETFKSVGYNRKAAAALLHMSRQTLSNKLFKFGYLLKDGSVRTDFKTWIEEQEKNKALAAIDSASVSPRTTTNCPPSPKKTETHIEEIPDSKIEKTLIDSGFNKKATATQLDISLNTLKKRLYVMYPNSDLNKGIPDELIISVYRTFAGDVETASAYMGITPRWMKKRLLRMQIDADHDTSPEGNAVACAPGQTGFPGDVVPARSCPPARTGISAVNPA